jgi:hypothetical protein
VARAPNGGAISGTRATSHTAYCGDRNRAKARNDAIVAAVAATSRSSPAAPPRTKSQLTSTIATTCAAPVANAIASGSEPARSRESARVDPRTTSAS